MDSVFILNEYCKTMTMKVVNRIKNHKINYNYFLFYQYQFIEEEGRIENSTRIICLSSQWSPIASQPNWTVAVSSRYTMEMLFPYTTINCTERVPMDGSGTENPQAVLVYLLGRSLLPTSFVRPPKKMPRRDLDLDWLLKFKFIIIM